ncbi:MAG: YhbY family RNA-binding protein [Clostridia bacterium]|nr:YhbY family RNA-binding protein [Clostridia bacterium]
MLTSKQRSVLRGQAQLAPVVVQIGKDGLTQQVVLACKDAFNTREIIKIDLLNTAGLDIKETAQSLALETKSEVLETKGRKLVLYKFNSKLKHKDK